MATIQSSIRFNPATRRQIDELEATGWGTITNIVATAIDRMYQQESKAMNERTILNDEMAVEWEGPGYYEANSVRGELRTVWIRVGTIPGGNPSYYATVVQRPEDLLNKKPAP